MLCLSLSLGPGLLHKKKVDWLPLDKLFFASDAIFQLNIVK